MTDGKAVTEQWAKAFAERHGAVFEPDHMHQLVDRERVDGGVARVAIVAMPFDCLVAALIHYTSSEKAQQKVRIVQHIAGVAVSRREYWNKIDRAHHWIGGIAALEAAIGDPARYTEPGGILDRRLD